MRIHLCLLALVWLGTMPAVAKPPERAAIASAHHLATEAGFEVYEQGGNAFDAAVAVSAALAVVEPASSGIGGGAFWLIHRASDNLDVMIDAREKAPGAAHRDMYLDDQGDVVRDKAINGPLAAGIPGEPAGLVYLSEKYGALPLEKALAPAIRLAREGFPADEKYVQLIRWRVDALQRWPAASEIFLRDGRAPEVGEIIVQPDLGDVLQALADQGRDGFYQGHIAEKLVEGVRADGGIWTLEDLAAYTVAEREPIRTRYRGYELVTAPPPSSGGIALATMLNVLSGFELDEMGEAARTHIIVEAMRRAYRDRALYLGDPDFVRVPSERLAHPFYAAGLRAGIRLDQATDSDSLPGIETAEKGSDTTHFSLADSDGNRVAGTLTINTPYGAAYVAPGTGVLLNNEMDDFSAKPGDPNAYGLIGENANAIAAHKRPLSSMTPTFVLSDDRVAVLGTPGGSRIITMVLLGILDFVAGNGPEHWVALPRFHHQYLPDVLSIEPDALSAEAQSELKRLGHTVAPSPRRWGNMNAVLWNRKTGEFAGASDPRTPSGKADVRTIGSTPSAR